MEHLRSWVSERSPRRRRPWLRPAYLLGVAEPSADVLAERAVRKISRHDERTHLLMLELVDQLLALDPRGPAPLPALPAGTATSAARSREPSFPGPGAR